MDDKIGFLENLGLVLLLIVFLGGAIINIIYWSDAKKFTEFQGYSNNSTFVLATGVVWQLFGLTLLLFPSTFQVGLVLLMLFVFVSSLQFYQFWRKKGLERYTNLLSFLSNAGVIGGLFLLLTQIQLHTLPFSFEFMNK